jgi:CorA-like Mg2+ transporter protein
VRPYFQDVLDHVRRVETRVGGLREILTSVFEAANLLEQQRQGVITRQLAAWAAILAVPTAIAGIYGMNFANMPELKDGLWLFHRPRRHRAALLWTVRPVQKGEVALDRFLHFSRERLREGPRDYMSSASAASTFASMGVGPNCEAIRLASVRCWKASERLFLAL